MVKFSKEFWIDGDTLDILDRDLYENIVIGRKKSTSRLHKITISYEIDREVTIKESELNGVLNKHLSSGLTVDTIMNELFGGGENE